MPLSHIEDLLADASGYMVRELVRGLREARERARERKEQRFEVVLRGPDCNNDKQPGQVVSKLGTTVAEGDAYLSPQAIVQSWVTTQRRAFKQPWVGPVRFDFLAGDGGTLCSGFGWGNVRWGPPAPHADNEQQIRAATHPGGEDDGMQDDDDEGGSDATFDDDPLGMFDEDAGNRHSMLPTRGAIDTIGLAREQRGITKDIERDDMLRVLFEVTMKSLGSQLEDARQTRDFMRTVAGKAVERAFASGGGGGGGRSEGKAAGDLEEGVGMFKNMLEWAWTLQQQGNKKPGGKKGKGRPANQARPTLPADPFAPDRWASPGEVSAGGSAVQRVLTAGSPQALDEPAAAGLPATTSSAQAPARRAAPVDPEAVIASLSDVDLIRAIQGRVGDIAGDQSPLVETFLEKRLVELEGEGGDEDAAEEDFGDDEGDDDYGEGEGEDDLP